MADPGEQVDGVVGDLEGLVLRLEVEGAQGAVPGAVLDELGVEVENVAAGFVDDAEVRVAAALGFAAAVGRDVAGKVGLGVEAFQEGFFEEAGGLVDAAEGADGGVFGAEFRDGSGQRGFEGGLHAAMTFPVVERDDLFAGAGFGHGGEGEFPAAEFLAEKLADESGVGLRVLAGGQTAEILLRLPHAGCLRRGCRARGLPEDESEGNGQQENGGNSQAGVSFLAHGRFSQRKHQRCSWVRISRLPPTATGVATSGSWSSLAVTSVRPYSVMRAQKTVPSERPQ